MASSTQNHQHHFPAASGTTSAPPPTPSTTNFTSTTDSAANDLLSRLLHRLPPSLSNTATTPTLLRRRSSLTAATATTPPVIPFTDLHSSISSTLPSISELGFFQLTNHSIPSELARAAESDSVSIFNLSSRQKHQHFPKNWPLGFDDDDDDEDGTESLFLDSSCSTESSELSLSHLRDFTREMETIGLLVVEALMSAIGLQNPTRDDPDGDCSLMWICDHSGDKMGGSVKFYPYVVGLQYQIRSQNCSLLTDQGRVSVSTQMDSILVTLGDIAQVWSNGKLKKTRGIAMLNMEENTDSSSVSMSLLVTLPLESTISSLLPRMVISDIDDTDPQNEDAHQELGESMFNAFPFEDYAWRVYHERVSLKDPLDRYRIRT